MSSSYIYFRVTGSVQGVTFRKSTMSEAHTLGLRGWVRNDSDGSVVGEAAGAADPIAKLRTFLHTGPSHAHVENVDMMYIKDHDVSTSSLPFPFEIRK
ncbi:hypothetical protein MVES_000089 [Malassezia vespertilionis]|uniref:Acylphosphatase n=1 Tax=Malassezia vespertilionis TaxID=2020962 RepID=A0A2N1JHG4_9BASI|nr:hypothetical protein MVES_000089 [Malassezia vespertilionis]